jgi:release factor family 3
MDAGMLSELRKPRAFPAVSVLMPTNRRTPANRQDPIRLRNLLAEVRRRLAADARVPAETVEEVVRGLERAVGEIDLSRAGDGLVLLAAPDGEHHAFTLDQPVDERVVIDTTFATRDLVAAYTRTARYWLLVLSDHNTRLWDGRADRLSEVTADGFPLRFDPPVLDDRTGKGFRSGEHGGGDEPRRQFYRQIVAALRTVDGRDSRPVIVAGVTRDQAYFEDAAGHTFTLAGRIDGSYDGTRPCELAELARPVLAAYEDLREVGVLAELEAARGIRRYAGGLDEVRRLAAEGRGAHLVVERGYYVPAIRTGTGLITMDGPLGALKGDGVVDDVVDDIIETVLEYGGEVTFVSDGFLVDHDRIALVVRY